MHDHSTRAYTCMHGQAAPSHALNGAIITSRAVAMQTARALLGTSQPNLSSQPHTWHMQCSCHSHLFHLDLIRAVVKRYPEVPRYKAKVALDDGHRVALHAGKGACNNVKHAPCRLEVCIQSKRLLPTIGSHTTHVGGLTSVSPAGPLVRVIAITT